MKFICEECGSDKVQQLQWVDMNTNEIMDSGPGDKIDYWCEGCDEHIGITTDEKNRK